MSDAATGESPTGNIVSIPVTKAKASVEINIDAIPQEMYFEALVRGLKDMVNSGMAKITVAKLEGVELEKAQAAAMEKAQANVEAINKGEFKTSRKSAATKSTHSAAVTTEAMRLAKALVKDTIRANKGKISLYKASQITAAAKAVLEGPKGAELYEKARAELAKREEATSAGIGIDLSALIQPDENLVAKAEAEKAEKKTQLSAKQAGKTKVRPKAKPEAHAGHTAH